MQLLNVLHGGSAIQHIPDVNGKMDHEQSHIEGFNDYKIPYHDIEVEKNSKLFEIIGESKVKTNSSHHQAVKRVGDNLTICAKASDGIIEAVENPNHNFCLGVQWHPEFETSDSDRKIFEKFVVEATKYKNR